MNALRMYHRWFGLVASLFLFVVSLTGIALQVDLWLTGNPPPGSEKPAGPPPFVRAPDRATLDRMSAAAMTAMRNHGDISMDQIAFNFAGPRPVVNIGSATLAGRLITVDPATGRETPRPKINFGYHGILQDLHAGYILGGFGRILSVLLGLVLLFLSGTGLWLYVELYRRRRKAGRKRLFWR